LASWFLSYLPVGAKMAQRASYLKSPLVQPSMKGIISMSPRPSALSSRVAEWVAPLLSIVPPALISIHTYGTATAKEGRPPRIWTSGLNMISGISAVALAVTFRAIVLPNGSPRDPPKVPSL
jgi:hypothetical protein